MFANSVSLGWKIKSWSFSWGLISQELIKIYQRKLLYGQMILALVAYKNPKVVIRWFVTNHNHSFHQPLARGGMHFNNSVEEEESLKNFFWRSGLGLMGKSWSIFGGGFWVFRNTNYKYYFTTLTWLTICMQTGICCITCCFSLVFLAYFVLLKVFIIVFYFINFINSLFKKNSA